MTDGKDKYIAGTQFNDTFTGENNVNNTYYFVGQNTTGAGPTDVFHGGIGTNGGSSWNVAILPDLPSQYTIQPDNTLAGATDVISNDPVHAGTLIVDSNVQALAFAPAVDPSGNSGSLTATGGGLWLLGPLPNGSEPITIGNGSMLLLGTADSANISFAGNAGVLALPNPSLLTGDVVGVIHQDANQVLDLGGLNAQQGDILQVSTSFSVANNTTLLTVTDTTVGNNDSKSVTLSGNYTADNWTASYDGRGGANVVDPPSSAVAASGITGAPINLALANPPAANGQQVTVTVIGVPNDWQLNQGSNLGNGTWAIETSDLTALTILTSAAYAGALVLGVTETWINADSTTGSAIVPDNVEAYAPGSPIFAISGADTLAGAGANDLFVFAQPIGNDVIHNFDVLSDKVDLVGFSDINGFGDIHLADDANGNAVVTLGSGETITLQGVDAASLTSSNFVFDQTPVTENAGTMVISDGAFLPLSGIIDNSGTIELNSNGNVTELQIIGDGITLEGGGQIVMSDSEMNFIVGTSSAATLTNVDNTISGAGQIGIGDGNLTLINSVAGTIDANFADGALILDTGHTIVNAGLLEATNGSTLQIIDSVSNSGTLEADGGTLITSGDVTGSGDVVIRGGGHAHFAAVFDQNVTFTGAGTFELDHSQGHSGTVGGFGTGDVIDLNDLAYSGNETVTWTQGSGSGILTINDNGTIENLTLNGNYTQGEFALTSNASGGTAVQSVASVDSTVVSGTSDLSGNISFVDSNPTDTLSASVTADGSGYVGALSLDPVTDNNGSVSLGFEFSPGNDQIGLASGQTLTQSYDISVTDVQNLAESLNQTVSVSFGGPGNDSFVFQPGIGADTIVNFNPQNDTIELDQFANAQTVQELQSLITTDAHGDAVIALGHNDSITLAGTTPAELQQVIQAGHVLLH